jgi:FAD/FMN-containing dehydrogenase
MLERLTGIMRRLWPGGSNADAPETTLNDIQSQLNPTRVARIVRPDSIEDIQAAIREATRERRAVSVAGGRHAQGGQQFGTDTIHIDTRSFAKPLSLDSSRGLVDVQGGTQWPELIHYLHDSQRGSARVWTIRQKQTGVDRVSIGGSLAANAHGRGLRWRSIVSDVESFVLIDAGGQPRTCSRSENHELFGLVVGGYGLFGVVAQVRLRLAPRQKLERVVKLIEIDDLLKWVDKRVEEGFVYGDCQYSIEPNPDSLSHPAVFACYRPVEESRAIPSDQKELSERQWLQLFIDAHTNKKKAFEDYSRHYLATTGQVYWSDTHQMSGFADNYHELVDRYTGATHKGSEQVMEVYLTEARLMSFLTAAREVVRKHHINLFYGTIRFLEKDDECFLSTAPERSVCVLCNLHIDHTDEGIRTAIDNYRRLVDVVIEHQGRYFLTYNRWATRDQVLACWPRLPQFLRLKKRYDPDELFQSDWYRHYRTMFQDIV